MVISITGRQRRKADYIYQYIPVLKIVNRIWLLLYGSSPNRREKRERKPFGREKQVIKM